MNPSNTWKGELEVASFFCHLKPIQTVWEKKRDYPTLITGPSYLFTDAGPKTNSKDLDPEFSIISEPIRFLLTKQGCDNLDS